MAVASTTVAVSSGGSGWLVRCLVAHRGWTRTWITARTDEVVRIAEEATVESAGQTPIKAVLAFEELFDPAVMAVSGLRRWCRASR